MDLASVRLTVDLTACSAARHANAGPHPCQDSPGLRQGRAARLAVVHLRGGLPPLLCPRVA